MDGVNETKPCPCCGGEPVFISLKSAGGYVRCKGDDIETRIFKTEAEAWAKWNRHAPSAARAAGEAQG